MIKKLIAAALVLALSSSPAWAWWEYAKWGMTAQQISAAAKRPLEPSTKTACLDGLNGAPVPTLQISEVTAGGLPANAGFAFDTQGKLILTRLCFSAVDPNTYRLKQALTSAYGAPVSVDNSYFASAIWRDAATGTAIKMFITPRSAISITYTPVSNGL